MIGILANPADECVVREFFEFFKTPWETYQAGRQYDVVLACGDVNVEGAVAKLVLVYCDARTCPDSRRRRQVNSTAQGSCLSYAGRRLPIYGTSVTFLANDGGILIDETSRECAACIEQRGNQWQARVGYDLFQEIRHLLTQGQPFANASIPTLELHIALLRDLILHAGIPLVEIPPVPEGHPFIACLTHDVDHPSIRMHKWDHTVFGFLYRAIAGSVANVFRGRTPIRALLKNYAATLRLPFVYLGLSRDFWLDFVRYPKLEGAPSTFFVIPFKDLPGQTATGPAPQFRASCYGAADLESQLRELRNAGCEVGLHGIDAWRDSSLGRRELDEIRRFSDAPETGVRMHWLYFDEHSPVALEDAGAVYDSTVGYNETVGYRAGTTQVFKPLQATRLLELPLHVMDTALFYPDHLNLSSKEAGKLVGDILDGAAQCGGVVTVNWHDRSIAPERLWGDFYVSMVRDMKERGAWFATAAQAVRWFRARRSVVFEEVRNDHDGMHVRATAKSDARVPAMRLRFHKPRKLRPSGTPAAFLANHTDVGFKDGVDVHFQN